LVSSVGLGDGVPVTLTRIRTGDNMKLQGVPGIAPRERLTVESAADELQSWLHKRLESMRESIAAIEGMLVPGQTVSRSGLRAACINLSRNAQDLPGTASYALEEFGRKAEEASERARTEIEAHASLIAQRAGLEALSGGGMVESSRRIEGRPDDTEIG
jgi:hypothetical protein